ncbi:hypothetical protein M422DRAFT_156544, partial [Sphaerobolus stellatus SS14]
LITNCSTPADPLPETLPLSYLDKSSGFIHLSTASQIPGTLKHFFAEDQSVNVLWVIYDDLKKVIRWEDPKGEVCGDRAGEGMFPHSYNGLRLGSAEVESMQKWERKEGGWNNVLDKVNNWLIY